MYFVCSKNQNAVVKLLPKASTHEQDKLVLRVALPRSPRKNNNKNEKRENFVQIFFRKMWYAEKVSINRFKQEAYNLIFGANKEAPFKLHLL